MKREWICGLVLATASTSQAFLVNASFEDPIQPLGGFTGGGIPGWICDLSSTVGVWNIPLTGNFNAEAPHGTQIGYTNASAIAQQSSAVVTLGLNTVSLQAGRRTDSFAGSLRLELYAGGAITSSATVVGGTLLGTANFDHTTVAPTTFHFREVQYVAAANDPVIGQALLVRIVRTAGAQANFDDVRINGVIPEPATMTLLGLGAFALWRKRR